MCNLLVDYFTFNVCHLDKGSTCWLSSLEDTSSIEGARIKTSERRNKRAVGGTERSL